MHCCSLAGSTGPIRYELSDVVSPCGRSMRSGKGQGPQFSLGANLVCTTSESRNRFLP
jgi:hypothetical protein